MKDFLFDFEHGSKRLFINLGMLHEPTIFFLCIFESIPGDFSKNLFQGGTGEPILQAHCWIFGTFANFHEFSSIT